jgi:hypothetical protein
MEGRWNRSLTCSALIAIAFIACVLTPRPAAAQFAIAPHIAWADDADLGIGGRLIVPFGPSAGVARIEGMAAFDWFFDCDDCSYYEITPAAVLALGLLGIGPYGGVGINIARTSFDDDVADSNDSETDVGVALIVGARIPMGLFGEIRYTAGGNEQKVIAVGFRLGG